MPQRYDYFLIIVFEMRQYLEKYRNTVNLENTYQTGCTNLPTVEQLELLGTVVEVVSQGDAVAPALDLPAFGPELEVNRVAGFEHLAKR